MPGSRAPAWCSARVPTPSVRDIRSEATVRLYACPCLRPSLGPDAACLAGSSVNTGRASPPSSASLFGIQPASPLVRRPRALGHLPFGSRWRRSREESWLGVGGGPVSVHSGWGPTRSPTCCRQQGALRDGRPRTPEGQMGGTISSPTSTHSFRWWLFKKWFFFSFFFFL